MEITNLNSLRNLVLNLKKNEITNDVPYKNKLILKFTAEWCGPCQGLKPILKKHIDFMINNEETKVKYYEIDIDETIDIFIKFKKMKMLNGIPAMFFYDGNQCIDEDTWFIPHDCVLGGNIKEVEEFIQRTVYK